MNVHRVMESSTANGPGKRAVIWTQGCSLHCVGCFNPDTHQRDVGLEWSTLDLVFWVVSMKMRHGLDGVTISGGEPLQQSGQLLAFLEELHKAWPRASVGIFTGYTWKEAEANAEWSKISAHLNFAVMGRYARKLKTKGSHLIGSANQKMYVINEHLYGTPKFNSPSVEVQVGKHGGMEITGFPVSDKLTLELAAAGIKVARNREVDE